MKKALKIILIIFAVIVAIALAYLAYVFISYHRVGDMDLNVEGTNEQMETLTTEKDYKIMSWNIGFGAYTADYSFFMDGGTESWAESPERLNENMADICEKMKSEKADIYSVQEVDIAGTRTYQLNECEVLKNAFPSPQYCSVTAQNFDSPFLFYPFNQPHGANKSAIISLSSFPISEAKRVELPVEDSVKKILDYDRCYSVMRIPGDGRDLVLYNFHLSAYTSDGSIATTQMEMVIADMQREYEKGNWCIAAGDFNKDLLGNSSKGFNNTEVYTWAQPLPENIFDNTAISLVAPFDEQNPIPSSRNADSPYHPGQFVVTLDGFMVTDNVEVKNSKVLDYGFAYSDHNPVTMEFRLLDKTSK